MLVMTAKVDMKKIIVILATVAVLILGLVLILDRGSSETTSSTNVAGNDARVAFLKSFGWEVTTSPKESGQVKIPAETTEVFEKYNALQKSMGYDLTAYAGKTVMRYVYQINNYPGATEPVYATLLVYKKQIIGGDVTDTAAKGVIRSFKMPKQDPTTPETTAPTETT